MRLRCDYNQELADRMIQNDEEAILEGAYADSSFLFFIAVLWGTRYKVKNIKFISALRDRLIHSKARFFGINLSDFVIAALDILDEERYEGDDPVVLYLISTNFDII